jgi:hypothetical protein
MRKYRLCDNNDSCASGVVHLQRIDKEDRAEAINRIRLVANPDSVAYVKTISGGHLDPLVSSLGGNRHGREAILHLRHLLRLNWCLRGRDRWQ